MPAHISIARRRPKVKSVMPEHHSGTTASPVRTLPRARSLQDCSEAHAEARAEARTEALLTRNMRMCDESIMNSLDQKSKSQSAGGSARGSAGGSAGGRPCSYELFLLPAHFKVARGRPKVKSVRKRRRERGRAARRCCSCELSLVGDCFKTARGRPKVKSVTACAPQAPLRPHGVACANSPSCQLTSALRAVDRKSNA